MLFVLHFNHFEQRVYSCRRQRYPTDPNLLDPLQQHSRLVDHMTRDDVERDASQERKEDLADALDINKEARETGDLSGFVRDGFVLPVKAV